MAISGGDGSIILTTKVDETGLKKGLVSLKRLGATAGKAFLAIGAAAAAATVAITKMATSAYADYEQLIGGVETLFKGSADKVKAYAENAFYTAGVSANEYMQQVTSFSASLIRSTAGDTDKAADIANMALIDISDNVNKMGSSMESVTLAYQGFAKQQYMLLDNLKLGYGGTKTEMERLLRDAEALTGVKYDINNLADVYSAIHAIQEELGITGTTAKEAEKTITGSANMMKAAWQDVLSAVAGGGDLDRAINNLVYSVSKYFENIVPVVERSLQGIGQLIERIAPMLVQTVARALIKAIPSLLNAIYQMIIGLAKGIYQGIIDLFKGGTQKVLETQTNEIAQSVENQNALTEAVEDTNKALKGSTASFDEVTTLSSNAAENIEDVGTTGTGQQISGVEEVEANHDNSFVSKISSDLAAIMGVVGFALAAIGIIMICFGHIGWGIGFLISGAGIFSVSQAALSGDSKAKKVKKIMNGIIAGISLLTLILGIILVATGGSLPLGIGLIIVGAAGLATEVAINWNVVTTAITNFLTDNAGLIVGISLSLLVLGIILCCCGIITPLSIGLIAAGAVGLTTEVALNWDSIVTSIREFLFENSTLIALISDGLLILGIILTCVGILPLGIALIAAGAVGLATITALNSNAIVDWIKGVWNAVKGFWNTHIAPIFTLTWWENLAKTCGNGLISGFEAAVNGVIWLFESLINFVVSGLNFFIGGLSTVTGAVGDLIGVDLRIPEIPKANLGRVSLPRLAQGAVIPPNREFLAVLGDQTHGTNVEAPLDTIKQALAEVMSNFGGNGNNQPIIVEIDGKEVFRAVRNAETRLGSRLVTGGV